MQVGASDLFSTVTKIKKFVTLKTVFRSRVRIVKKKLARLGHVVKSRMKDAKDEATKTTGEMLAIACSVLANAKDLRAELQKKGAKKAGKLDEALKA